MRKLFITLVLVLLPWVAHAQTTIFNCSSFTTTAGSCDVGGLISNTGTSIFKVVGSQNTSTPAVSGGQVVITTSGAVHSALTFAYQTQVNVQAFTTTFTFIPMGWETAFMLSNSNNNPTFNGVDFSAGAGCEGNFYQGFSQTNPPNNVWAIEFDSYQPLTNGAIGTFSYSSAQMYQSNVSGWPNIYIQCPCMPLTESCGTNTGNAGTPITKISTSPVAMNSPSNSANTSTGHTFSATITYDGSNVTLKMFDVTGGGSCPGASCFTQSWSGINIPTSVSSNNAWAAIGQSVGSSPSALNNGVVGSWSYTVNPATAMPGAGHMGQGGMW